MIRRRRDCLFVLTLLASTTSPACGSAPGPSSSSLSTVIQGISRNRDIHMAITRAIPALSIYRGQKENSPCHETMEVAVKKKVRRKLKFKIPQVQVPQVSKQHLEQGGFYYGITPQTYGKAVKSLGSKPLSVKESMQEALQELRSMRLEMERMRVQMEFLKKKMMGEEDTETTGAESVLERRKKQRDFDKVASDVEQWAKHLLFEEGEEDGWKEVACNKMMRKSVNSCGSTRTYIKWLRDSRGAAADKSDDTEYPCIKVFTTIDAPMEAVCAYLSQEDAFPDYNDILEKYKDVEEISPHSKICWSQSPQILFLKPRDFVTFCHHRWTRDGTQVVVNQATEHPDLPGSREEREGKACRAYALRGANFISRNPNDPEKTNIAMLAHANPGGNVPEWATKTAVNALTPIEPFKLFHKINENVKRTQPHLRELMARAEMVSLPGGRSSRPAGIAQMGYACFWPNGGGLMEGGSEQQRAPPEQRPQQEGQPQDDSQTDEDEPQSKLVEVEGDGSES